MLKRYYKIKNTDEKGFSLLELIVVVAVIGVMVSIAIPSVLRSRLIANENAVKANLRTFSSAIEAYRANLSSPNYPSNYSQLNTTTPPYIDETWGTGTTVDKSGYTVTYGRVSSAEFGIYAEPIQANNTGIASFCVDETGVLFTSTTSSGAFSGSPCSAGTGATPLA